MLDLDIILHLASAICLVALAFKGWTLPKYNKVYIAFLAILALGVAFKGVLKLDIIAADLELLFWRISLYVVLPMMFMLLATLFAQKSVSLDYWGRVFLGLCAGFELSRQSQFLDQYLYVVIGLQFISVAFIAYAVFKQRVIRWSDAALSLALLFLSGAIQIPLDNLDMNGSILLLPVFALTFLTLTRKLANVGHIQGSINQTKH